MFDTLIEPIRHFLESVVSTLGYPGIALMMLLDSANIPIPSEIVMPAGGILAAQGKMEFWLVGLAGTVGTVLGSCLNYYLGYRLGEEGLVKYGKFLLIRRSEVHHGKVWFGKYGEWSTLWARFVPLARTFISLPAGIYRMNFPKFFVFAVLGAAPWCYGWAYIGFRLWHEWESLKKYWHYVDAVVVIAAVYLLIKFLRYRLKSKENGLPEAPHEAAESEGQ